MSKNGSSLPELLRDSEQDILSDWVQRQLRSTAARDDILTEKQLREQSREFLSQLRQATESGELADVEGAAWRDVRQMLEDLSRTRARQGFSARETAKFVFSLKEPLFERLRARHARDGDLLAIEVWQTTALLDQLGLYTTEVYARTREEIIARQQHEMMELSTPVVTLWREIVALPLIGTLDSARTQVVMETLLQRIVEVGAQIAIIDITGVPTVDTLVAQHLLKTVAAARLMGAECIISGIRPQIAQTIVHLGVELGTVNTKATLADAVALALRLTGQRIVRAPAAQAQ